MDKLVENLRACVGREQVLSEDGEVLVYECDGLPHHKARPRAVVFPRSTEEVAAVMRVLLREGVSFAPRGAGTGLSGGALAVGSGVLIELSRMRKVLKLDLENARAVVETGLVNAHLSRAVARHALHYVPDPSSQATCTIGGNIAENAGGIHCLKYGTTVDHVLGVRVVLSDGQIVELGGAGAEAPGYDLLGVFIGSEGTFGIATEATVRLTPVAPAVRTLLADFTNVDDASRAVSAIIAAGIIPAALEMVDGATIRAVEASVFAAGLPADAEAALLVELDGHEAGLDAEAARVSSLCTEHGARSVRLAADENERRKLWAARKGAFGAMGRVSPDLMIQDAVVPRSRLPEVLAATYSIAARYDLRIANVFHAGDGNLHPIISFDARRGDEVARVREAGREIMETCVRAGGTITGEHGVGLDKSEYLPLVFSEEDMRAMLLVRAAFDPDGLCNPQKIIPAPPGCGEARAAARIGGAQEKLNIPRNGARAETVAEARSGAGSEPASSLTALSPAPRVPGRSLSVFDAERASGRLAGIVGAEHVKVDESVAHRIEIAPRTPEEACEVLRCAAAENWKVLPAGSSKWLDAGNDLSAVNLVVTTARMSQLVAHEPADLVATAGAGMALADFNRRVGGANQWLPLDPPCGARATLGGMAATGLAGAQSLGYGAPRGYVLGMSVAMADGKLVRAGGRVVKNVAGYDLCKLFVGSYGTLGLITELTFKLRPRPACERTLVTGAKDISALFKAARVLLNSHLSPVAVELLSPALAARVGVARAGGELALLARFAGSNETVEHQLGRARELFGKELATSVSETIDEDAEMWSSLAAAPSITSGEVIWRASVLPSELGAFISKLGAGDALWQAGAGTGRVRVFEPSQEEDARAAVRLSEFRDEARRAGGSLVIERAPGELKRALDAWGVADAHANLMRRIKRQLDPSNLFSPGRFFAAD